MLTPQFNRLESWHSARFARPWLGPLPITRGLILAALVMALIAVFANVKVRYDQGQIWKANPEITEISGAMSFSTADAPYFLGHAAAAERGLSPDDFMRKRIFPNAEAAFQQANGSDPQTTRPLLSTLISLLSPSASIGDLLNASHSILLFSAGLTAVMIILAFGATGYWLEGTVAAVGGGLSTAYLVRSSFGRIDTDQLNLGLMYVTFGIVLLSARSKNTLAVLLWAVLAGIFAKIFVYWYGKAELIWMAIATYFWLLCAFRKRPLTIVTCLLVFYAFAPVTLPNPLNSSYVQENFIEGTFLFPNTLKTITETSILLPGEILEVATGSIEMGIVGLFGLGLWAIRHPVIAFAYLPLIAFALLNFIIGNRAVFYSAPCLWFGVAFLLSSSGRLIYETVVSKSDKQHPQNDTVIPLKNVPTAGIAAGLLSLLLALVNSPTDYLPRPSFPKPVLQGLIAVGDISINERSIVATWWDYGYASLFLNNLPTLHDGGSQTGPNTHFFARAILTADQQETISILKLITNVGNAGINKYKSEDELLVAAKESAARSSQDIYIVLTAQMAEWIGSISKLGNWDIETGTPTILENNNGAANVEYINLGCNYRGFPTSVTCDDTLFDFENGLINNNPLISGWSRARDGFADEVRRYSVDAPFGMQTLQTNNRLSSQLMHRQLYDSSFNKLYHLGLIEAPGITLVYDNYPDIRIYKIAGTD